MTEDVMEGGVCQPQCPGGAPQQGQKCLSLVEKNHPLLPQAAKYSGAFD